MENQTRISIFIYTISEIALPCIVLILNSAPKFKFHIHDVLKIHFMYIPISDVIQEHKEYIHGIVKEWIVSIGIHEPRGVWTTTISKLSFAVFFPVPLRLFPRTSTIEGLERPLFRFPSSCLDRHFFGSMQSLETWLFWGLRSRWDRCFSAARADVETAASFRPMPSSGTRAPGLDLSPNIMVMRVAARPAHDLEINYITRSRAPHEKQE